jgi:hypothetical protein
MARIRESLEANAAGAPERRLLLSRRNSHCEREIIVKTSTLAARTRRADFNGRREIRVGEDL